MAEITPFPTRPDLVDLRDWFPELYDRAAPGGAVLDRSLRPMPAPAAAAFLRAQVGLWEAYNLLNARRLDDRGQPLREVARRRKQLAFYARMIGRADVLLKIWEA